MEQQQHGIDVWRYPLIPLPLPKIEDLDAGPFERGEHEGIDYGTG